MKNYCLTFKIFLGLLMVAEVPFLHAQWVKTIGPDSVRALASPDGIVVYAGTRSGVFLSSDSGSNWSVKNNGLTHTNVRSLLLRPGMILVGTEGGGIFRSMNNGTSWVSANNGLTGLDVRALDFSASHLFAGTNAGVFRSADSGVNWSAFNTGLTNLDVRAVAGVPVGTSNTRTMYAGTAGSGVFRFSSGDSIWRAQNDSLTNLDIRAIGNNGPNLYAGTTAGGHEWSAQSSPRWFSLAGIPSVEINSLAGIISPGAHDNGSVLAGTAGAGVFLIKYSGPGQITAPNEGLTDLHIHAITDYENFSTGYLFVGTSSGVWRRLKQEVIPAGVSVQSGGKPSRQFTIHSNGSASFMLATPARVTLSVYSPTGRKVAALFSEEFKAGFHTPQSYGSKFPNGLYLYKLEVGSDVTTRKVIRTN